MKTIKGFEGENIVVSDFGEWVGKNYIDYKSEYKNNRKIIKSLFDENSKLKDNWNKLEENLWKIRQLTFTKYNKNEWENCLSFNDDILPLIKKMKELEQGSDNDVED